jgi:hypothetical protein
MSLEELKAEVRSASPEAREELFALLGVLRRARDPERAHALAARLDDPAGWVSEEDAARRLGMNSESGE